MSRKNLGILNCLPENLLPIDYKRPHVNSFHSYDSIEKLELTILKSDVKSDLVEFFNDKKFGLKKQLEDIIQDRNIETFGVLKNITEKSTSHIFEVDLYIKNLTIKK